jgi:hypothetical protein
MAEAARIGGAIARAITYAPLEVYYYPDRKWQGIPDGMTYTFSRDGTPQIDARWFPIFRFYGPSQPYFDKTWKLNDIEEVRI